MNRRRFVATLVGLSALPLVAKRLVANTETDVTSTIEKIERSNAEWRKLLTPEQYHVLREEGTERSHASPLNDEKRAGIYTCAGCALPLFSSEMKYDSGTGWPSFYTSYKGVLETKTDFRLILPRKEYHCARCGGHHGHIFKDGPAPTGLRYCNNGVALKFIANKSS